jgi:uncharacterized protein YggE
MTYLTAVAGNLPSAGGKKPKKSIGNGVNDTNGIVADVDDDDELKTTALTAA